MLSNRPAFGVICTSGCCLGGLEGAMPIRLVLADDHPLILDALEQLFGLEPDFEVLARCQNGEEALKAIDSYKPDVLILDLRMPLKDGRAVLRAMQQAQCPTRVDLLT